MSATRRRPTVDELPVYGAATRFASGRLAERGTLEWALTLGPSRRAERAAILSLLEHGPDAELAEPWAGAWRLIEESWQSAPVGDSPPLDVHRIGRRLKRGDRSGAIVHDITALVAPRLDVSEIDPMLRELEQIPARPRKMRDLLRVDIESGPLVDPGELGLDDVDDASFLLALVTAVEGALEEGLALMRRIYATEHYPFKTPNRVYYARRSIGRRSDRDPDAGHGGGITAATKLLHAFVERLAALGEHREVRSILDRWLTRQSPVFRRLWAAMARDPKLAGADEVEGFILGLTRAQTWNVSGLPEVIELRATRFTVLSSKARKHILAGIRKGPPRNLWARGIDAHVVETARRFWSARELRRLELAGSALTERDEQWLGNRLAEFPELETMSAVEGFPEGIVFTNAPTASTQSFDVLRGEARVRALEKALTLDDGVWANAEARAARAWLRVADNAEAIAIDLESTSEPLAERLIVWKNLLAAHRPVTRTAPGAPLEDSDHVARVLRMASSLADAELARVMEALCSWLDAFRDGVVTNPGFPSLWIRLWGIASTGDHAHRVTVPVDEVSDEVSTIPLDLVRQGPIGILATLFVAFCFHERERESLFDGASDALRMRNVLSESGEPTATLATYVLLHTSTFFLEADEPWARSFLIEPLLSETERGYRFWTAMAYGQPSTRLLHEVGLTMAKRAADRRLDRHTRGRLAMWTVVESLFALHEQRASEIPEAAVQQMLRTIDDDIRADAADGVYRFLRDVAGGDDAQPASRTAVFLSAIVPFFERIWPRESTLSTSVISAHFACVPAISGDAFERAVNLVEKYLLPFDVWTMASYGFFRKEGDRSLAMVDDPAKAGALLTLLDRTIGTA